MRTTRLKTGDREHARKLFTLMAEVFAEDAEELRDAYLDRLLGREDFWAIAAFAGESSELFLYDIAVRVDQQRRGVGRALLAALREQAAAQGITEVFVAADDEDTHALDFYRALGGDPAPVTFFTFSRP
jgi:aminoglycoside 3-N-acetyltransferase I